MARHTVLCSLVAIAIGCGSSEGLRVEWHEVPQPASGEPELVVETGGSEAADHAYTLEIESTAAPVIDIAFLDPGDGRFILRELDCSWQGNRCVGTLPYEARRSHYLTVRAYRNRCPEIRLFRNGLEIDVERMRLRACAFSMEADPD